MKQLALFIEKIEKEHGGELRKGKRKTARPLDSKSPIHLVFKTTNYFLLLKNQELVLETIHNFCAKLGITSYKIIVHQDHIHIVIKIPNRDLYCRWVRSVTGVLARKIKGLEWSEIPYTRVASWGRDFKNILNYLGDNQKEVDFIKWTNDYVVQSQRDISAEIERLLVRIGGRLVPAIAG